MGDEIETIGFKDIINTIIKRKKLIAIITLAFIVLGLLHTFIITEDKYSTEFVIEVNIMEQDSRGNSSTGIAYELLENMSSSMSMSFEQYVEELDSEEVLERTIDSLDTEYSVSELKDAISISSDPDNEIINLKIVFGEKDKGLKILETLTEEYKGYITEISKENSEQVIKIIEEQIEREEDEYSAIVEEYKNETEGSKSALELEMELEGIFEQLTKYKQNLNDLEVEKDSIEAALNKGSTSSGSIMLKPSGSSETIYIGAGKEALENQIIQIEGKIDSTEKTIEELQESVDVVKIDYNNVEFKESKIRQKLELAKESYEAFTQKYQELEMQRNLDIGGININVMQGKTQEDRAVGMNKSFKMVLFFIVGFMTSLIVTFTLEYLEYIGAINSKNGNDK